MTFTMFFRHKKKNRMELGEIYILTEERTATLDVKSDKPQRVSLIVQDKLGTPCFEQQINLEKGSQTLQFPVEGLKPGSYFVWLHYGNHTKMVSFKVNTSTPLKPEPKKNFLLGAKFFSW